MKRKLNQRLNPVFNPQDRYYINSQGWWFYTVERISGPYKTKTQCVAACRYYIQKRAGILA
jgi:hypothetical protein